ncbi:MAG: hypothetical protein GX418_04400 [Clostridiales bacterium]|nr:hypothetical protein [Clostridiales bacterium]
MKREELEKLGLTKEQIDAVMGIHGADVEAHKAVLKGRDDDLAALRQDVAAKETQITDLAGQLKKRDEDMKALQKDAGASAELQTKLADLQGKYDGDTKALQAKLEQQRYDYAAEQLFVGVPFASKLARKAAIEEFKGKGYKLTEDGKSFVGADGYIDALKKDDPAAFLPEKPPEPKEAEPAPPAFTKPLGGGDGGVGAKGFFTGGGLNFVRTPPTK